MSNARIKPGGFRDTGPAIWAFARVAGVVTGTNPPHVFTTLGRGRGLFWGWLHFAGRMMPAGVLPRRESELVILRVAHLRGSDYEFDHHTRLGRRVGVTDDDLVAVVAGPTNDHWTGRERSMLAATDELVATKDLSDDAWSALIHHLDDRAALELLLLVGHYDMLATTLQALRVEPDRPGRLRRIQQRISSLRSR